MQRTVRITLALSEDAVQKLVELAGSESLVDEYVSRLAVKLHTGLRQQGGVVDLEQAVLEIHDLVKNQRIYKQEIHNLRRQLRHAHAIQHQLLVSATMSSQQTVQRANTVLH